MSAYASLVGGMVMARAVDDRALSQEILNAVLASVSTQRRGNMTVRKAGIVRRRRSQRTAAR
jgi:hypothetical protein